MKFFLSSLSLATLLVLPNGSNAFTLFPNQPSVNTRGTPLFMKVGVFFGTSTGNTEECAEKIAEKLGAEGPFMSMTEIRLWRPSESMMPGCWYPHLEYRRRYRAIRNGMGRTLLWQHGGYVSTEGYLHDDSKAIRGGDKFCGLLLDMVNQEELTDERIDNWIAQLGSEGFLEGEGDAVQDAVVIEAAAVMPDTPPTTGTMENLEQLEKTRHFWISPSHLTTLASNHTQTNHWKDHVDIWDGTKCFIPREQLPLQPNNPPRFPLRRTKHWNDSIFVIHTGKSGSFACMRWK
ncbi:Flavodoxin [Seminavis robusta]|uniref:Flavodoxin n=1 Tax=Seminavis robusta TaxID=568900 RepID=A0A9N8EW01_9STRA|nr:Flavodoxin [Seminavis robusta]|eukprot:Sro1985_g309400.1 Flavodoxin (290) ;mRNA; f:1446-2619